MRDSSSVFAVVTTEMFIRNGSIAPGADGLPVADLDVVLVDQAPAIGIHDRVWRIEFG